MLGLAGTRGQRSAVMLRCSAVAVEGPSVPGMPGSHLMRCGRMEGHRGAHRYYEMGRDRELATLWRKRTRRIPAMSKRRQLFENEFNRAKTVVILRSGGFCEARTSACSGFAEHVHHRAGRVGRDVNTPEMLLHVCFRCHEYLHRHPLESYAQGWLVRRVGRVA